MNLTRHSIRHFLVAACLILAVSVTACSKEESKSSPTAVPPADIQIILGAPQIEYAGVYAAISQGYFTDEKLNVDLEFTISAESNSSGSDSLDAVNTGEAVFADSTAETLLGRRQEGYDIVALLTLYQRDSRSIVSTSDHPITTPADLVGKRLLLVPGTKKITTVFLKTVGINPDDITFVDGGDQGVDWFVTQILTGQVDGLVFSIEGAAQMEAAGLETTRIAYYDYGVQSYANVLFTSRQMIEQHPELVQRFVNAVVRGMQYAIEQPEELAAWFVENYGDQLHPLQVSVQDEAMLAIIPLMQTATSKPGMMSGETWAYLTNDLVTLDLLDATVNPDDAYTLQFLNAYYQ